MRIGKFVAKLKKVTAHCFHCMQGDVLLQPSSLAALTIVVTTTAETATRLDDIRLQYQDANSAVTLTTQNVNDECGSGAQLQTSSLSVLLCSVFASLLLTRWSGFSISKWIFLLGAVVSLVAMQVYAVRTCTRADVTVLVPR